MFFRKRQGIKNIASKLVEKNRKARQRNRKRKEKEREDMEGIRKIKKTEDSYTSVFIF